MDLAFPSMFGLRFGLRCLLVCFAGTLLPSQASDAVKSPLRIVVTAEPLEIADLVAAGISKDPEITLIERSQAALLFDAAALDVIAGDAEKQRKLGKFLEAERILNIRRVNPDSWELRVIDAASGRLLDSRVVAVNPESLATEAARLLHELPTQPPADVTKVAVLDFSTLPGSGTIALVRLATELRLRLAEAGIEVLDRTVSTQIRNEHALTKEGWVASPIASMAGADHIVAGQLSKNGHHLRLEVLAAATGHTNGAEEFPFSPDDPSIESKRIAAWVLQKLETKSLEIVSPSAPSRQIEALEPFYKGITLVREGRDLEAIDEFQKAYSLNDKFTEAYLWEAACYEKVGLIPLAFALRAYIERDVVGKGISSAEAYTDVDGVTFLGITGAKAGLRRKLEVLVTETAAPLNGHLLLPENLAAFRDEYDALLGVSNSRGTTWADAPSFLTKQTLSGRIEADGDGQALVLELRNTVSDRLLALARVTLKADASTWPESLSAAIRKLRNQKDYTAEDSPAVRIPLAAEASENTRILCQALEEPSGLAANWRPLQKPSYDLPRALNFALREVLLSKIPAGDGLRPWMELERIAAELPFDPWATPYVSQIPDPISELEAFIKRHPNEAPGLLGEYMVLWETISAHSYKELERRWEALDKKLSGLSAIEPIAGWDQFRKMPTQLRDLARVAQGRGSDLPPCDDWFAAPHRMIPRVGQSGRISLEPASPWGVREWRHLSRISPADATHEARAALAILGRGNNRFTVDPQWMEEFPNSLALTSYVIRSLREADRDEGLPVRTPFNASAERAHYLAKVRYVDAQLRRIIAGAESPKELNWIEGDLLREFFTALSRPGFRRTLSDDEVRSMHQALIADVDQAAVRLGRGTRPSPRDPKRTWKQIDRSVSSFADPRWWTHDQIDVYDLDVLRARAADQLSKSVGTPLLSSPWSRTIQSYAYATLTPVQRAELLMAGRERLWNDYKETDLSADEMASLVQYGTALIAGKKYPDAEKILRLIAELPESDVNRTGTATEARANAQLHLTALALHDGREIEAADRLRRILADAPARPIGLIEDGGWHPQAFESVQAVALRLLADLRAVEKPENGESGVVQVKTAGYFPGKVLFRYRPPTGIGSTDGAKIPVLVISPSINDGAERYLEGEWARFADAHGVFLLVPQFMEFWSDSTLPQDWSGEALHLALTELKDRYPIDTDRLYFHGFGFGASFLERVALWKPGWCAAASLHSTFDWAWEETLPEGLQPLETLEKTPFFVTCGEEDGSPDHSIRGSFASTVRFVTYAKAVGVPVVWKPLPGVAHRPTREMENEARAFLTGQFARRRPGGER